MAVADPHSSAINQFASDSAVQRALANFYQRYQAAYHEAGQPLLTELIDDWPEAPIYTQRRADGWVEWAPQRRQQALDFSDLEHALEQPFPDSFRDYFNFGYSADVEVSWQQQPLLLLHMQCDQDSQRFLQNLAGHVLMKRRLKQPITLFLGLAADADDLLLTQDCVSGAMGLEWVGKPQHQMLTEDLASFIEQLTPRVIEMPEDIR